MKLAVATISAVAVLIATAPVANAWTVEEQHFLDLQRQHGWTIWDPAQHLRVAHTVCETLNYENGELVIEDLTAANPGRPLADHAEFLWDAVITLCPWHDHTAEIAR